MITPEGMYYITFQGLGQVNFTLMPLGQVYITQVTYQALGPINHALLLLLFTKEWLLMLCSCLC